MIKVGSKVRCTISASQLSKEIGIVKEIEDNIALVYYPDLDERDLIDDVTFLHNNNGKYKEEKYIWLDIKMIKEIEEDIMFKVGDKVRYVGDKYMLLKDATGIITSIHTNGKNADVYYPDLEECQKVCDYISLHSCGGEYSEKKYLYVDLKSLEIVEEANADNIFKVGDKVQIIKNTSCHGFSVGQIVTINEEYGGKDEIYRCVDDLGNFWYVKKKEVCAVKEFHSSHYEGKIEPIEFIMANKMSFNRGNIIKYATRACKKSGQEKLDIHKIIDYAMLMAFEEGVDIDKDDIIKLVNYRFDWKKKRGDK